MAEDPTDYAGKAKQPKAGKPKAEASSEEGEKKGPIVTAPVIVKKKGIFRKVKDTLVEVDFRSTVAYVIADVLIPAAKETVFDALVKGGSYSIFGDRSVRGRGRTYHSGSDDSYVTYNRGVDRGSRSMGVGRRAPEPQRGPRNRRYGIDNFIITDKQEADLIVESMLNAIEEYEYVTVGDLNEMLGIDVHPIDNKWGWTRIDGIEILQVREGYLIDLPEPEAL